MAGRLAVSPGGDEPRDPDLAELARRLAPRAPALDRHFLRRLASDGYGAAARKALAAITPGAAARLLAAGRPASDFIEQVEYNGRRLAKLNVPPHEAEAALESYDRLIGPLLAAPELKLARQSLHYRTLLALHGAFYQVREAETQAFYGLFRAEVEAAGLEDLLRRSVALLARALRAQAGRLAPAGQVEPRLLRRLARPRYLEGAKANAELVLDAEMRGRYASYWSVPLRREGRLAAVLQFGFAAPYRWLPRELELLDAAGERALAALDRARLARDLAAREAEVRCLAAHLSEVEEEERRRISRELHDEAGQSLLFLRLELEKLERSAAVREAGLEARLAQARQVAEGVISEIRRAIAALAPATLERLGLAAALRQLAAGLRQARGTRVRVRVDGPAGELPQAARMVLYRVAQECIQNIARHAGASQVNIRLRTADKELRLDIADDGSGFDPEAAARKGGSFGLAGMRERVALLGGALRIRSRLGRGTEISVRLPLRPQPGGVRASNYD